MPGASYVTVTPFTDVVGGQTQLVATRRDDVRGVRRARVGARGDRSVQRDRLQRRRSARTRWACASRSARRAATSCAWSWAKGCDSGRRAWCIGALIAIGAAKWIKPLLFAESPRDPVVFAVVTLTLLAVTIAASWVPARRAARVDPNVALRTE